MVRFAIAVGIVWSVACGGKSNEPAPAASATGQASGTPLPDTPPPKIVDHAFVERPATGSAPAGPSTPAVSEAPAGNPPPDGKYERVVVDGVTVPMVQVMDGGTVVLVDSDGKKPRSWEEQYKRKSAKLAGQLDVHKTDANRNGKFDDDAIDREGMWLLDVKGNVAKH